MLDFMKSTSNALKYYIDRLFKKSVANWEQSDETQLDYIKNKTHYDTRRVETKNIEITFDGVLAGKEHYLISDGDEWQSYIVKLSDIPLSLRELRGAVGTYQYYDGSIDSHNDSYIYVGDDTVHTQFLIIPLKDTIEYRGDVILTRGVWTECWLHTPTNKLEYVKSFINTVNYETGDIKKLDDKYLSILSDTYTTNYVFDDHVYRSESSLYEFMMSLRYKEYVDVQIGNIRERLIPFVVDADGWEARLYREEDNTKVLLVYEWGIYIEDTEKFPGSRYEVTFYNSSKSYIDDEYLSENIARKSDVDSVRKQSNYKQNDNTQLDYIRNRTHYVTYEFLENSEVMQYIYTSKQYEGLFDAVYDHLEECVFRYRTTTSSEYIVVSPLISSKTDTQVVLSVKFNGYSYYITINDSDTISFKRASGSTHSYQINIIYPKYQKSYHTLDENFIPGSIMRSTDSVGSGNFSFNRQENTDIGDHSVSLGSIGLAATRQYQQVTGVYNDYERENYIIKQSSSAPSYSDSTIQVYKIDSYTFDSSIGVFKVENPVLYTINTSTTTSHILYFVLPVQNELPSVITEVCEFRDYYQYGRMYTLSHYKYSATQASKYKGKYLHMVGNGTSNTNRSNAHTLDWEGNAEYQGDVVAKGCGGENPISLVDTYNKVNLSNEETAKMLADADIVDIIKDDNEDIFTDSNGDIIVF